MKPTETFNDGAIELHNADCMDVLRATPDRAYQIAIVDPPYFKDASYRRFSGGETCRTRGVKRNQYPRIGEWSLPTPEYFTELMRVSERQIVWGINYFTEAAAAAGFTPGGRVFWNKVNTKATFSDGEIAAVSQITGVRMFTFMWNGMLQGSEADGSVQEGNKKLNEKRIHPTQKPVQLYRWLLETFAKPGDRILDTHLGGGSIAIACHDRGHRFTGIEIDKTFYANAAKRIRENTLQLPLFTPTPELEHPTIL